MATGELRPVTVQFALAGIRTEFANTIKLTTRIASIEEFEDDVPPRHCLPALESRRVSLGTQSEYAIQSNSRACCVRRRRLTVVAKVRSSPFSCSLSESSLSATYPRTHAHVWLICQGSFGLFFPSELRTPTRLVANASATAGRHSTEPHSTSSIACPQTPVHHDDRRAQVVTSSARFRGGPSDAWVCTYPPQRPPQGHKATNHHRSLDRRTRPTSPFELQPQVMYVACMKSTMPL
ncbi:hypothetical protein OH76DRAFT_1418648 [Lentinus brumalis]|uniref:Uncharacterized protein n=1 Tax=Lentinus brumalis TaxID=2498619 RepID=A0A371D9H0_9APHY|nr:hypothetical protein OH76DRAFT_1418648 [Polyporus brumalis]